MLATAKPETQPKVIRDKAFAKRLEIAVENHPQAPSGHGRQKWLKDRMSENFNTNVSPEGVRKWFAGEARPKPKMMSLVARALAVDEAWLSLGIAPTDKPEERKKRNAMAGGAVNLVAAQIQLAGGNIAFADPGSPFDLFAILKGKQHSISVSLLDHAASQTFHVPMNAPVSIVVLPTENPTVFRYFGMLKEGVAKVGEIRGDYVQVDCEAVAGKLVADSREIPEIRDFRDLEAVLAAL